MTVTVEHGDSRDVLKTLADCSVASVVTDPPYALVSIGKRFGKDGAAPAKAGKTGAYARASAGFMGQQWDTGQTAFDSDFWAEVYRVLKPGGHVLAFGGTRTYHRLVCAIEDAGFEIRDTISWNFGSGFPKSHDVGKNLDKQEARCACDSVPTVRDGGSPGTLPSGQKSGDLLHEVMQGDGARGAPNPVRQQRQGEAATGEGPEGLGQSSVERRGDLPKAPRKLREREIRAVSGGPAEHGEAGRLRDGASAGHGALDRASPDADRDGASHRPQSPEQRAEQSGTVAGQSQPQAGGAWPLCGGCGKPIVPDGLGTALKPAMELICVGRKPLIGTVAANVLEHGTGALNIDGCRIEGEPTHGSGASQSSAPVTTFGDMQAKRVGVPNVVNTAGRWPANVVHDGSEEVVRAFPDTGPGQIGGNNDPNGSLGYHGGARGISRPGIPDSGSAARFFYSAKADADDRLGSKHPTVKPVDLMRWLVRLVTPKGGLVLDPFAGSGTTGMACMAEGFDCLLIEREPQYVTDIRRRLAHVHGTDTPLFSTAPGGKGA